MAFGDNFSDYQTIKCGIPQGSILEPLHFILYINGIVNSSNLLKFILFADDTNILYSNKNIDILYETLNNELEKVSKWLIANRLSVNFKKLIISSLRLNKGKLPIRERLLELIMKF